jgi:hypothetical protein
MRQGLDSGGGLAQLESPRGAHLCSVSIQPWVSYVHIRTHRPSHRADRVRKDQVCDPCTNRLFRELYTRLIPSLLWPRYHDVCLDLFDQLLSMTEEKSFKQPNTAAHTLRVGRRLKSLSWHSHCCEGQSQIVRLAHGVSAADQPGLCSTTTISVSGERHFLAALEVHVLLSHQNERNP